MIWQAGDTVVVRGIYKDQICHVQSARVVKDSTTETVLLVEPGAECAAPSGYLQHRHVDQTQWDRWRETLNGSLNIQICTWHTNRFLILLEPEKYFSTIYIWDHASGEFLYYYINFQLPFRRSQLGFDTLDLDLDILVNIENEWEWKDLQEYEKGIRSGGIMAQWIDEIQKAQAEVFARIDQQAYPLDRTWLGWLPDPGWPKTTLPSGWDQLDKG